MFKYVNNNYRIRSAYEATGKLTRFTDYNDIKYRSRTIFSFHKPETLKVLLAEKDTIRNNMKRFPEFDTTGFRKCQVTAIQNLDQSFVENRPKALVQMATGAGKTFTAITAAYRLLKYGKMKRILFLVDTKSLGEQAEREFLAYTPNDENRSFSQLYGVRRLKTTLLEQKEKECIIGVGQHYDLYIGSNAMRGNPNMRPITGDICYDGYQNSYSNKVFIDLKNYMTFFSATTDNDDLLKAVKKNAEELKGIRRVLQSLQSLQAQGETNE